MWKNYIPEPSGKTDRANIRTDPVSYTHLDVYKRQILQCARSQNSYGHCVRCKEPCEVHSL